jgi:putative CocE/NonD family hydrolase
MNVTDGIQRARYRKSWSNPEPMIPGEPTVVDVSAFPTSNLFKAGHRIRLDISSSNFPHFDVNPNTGGPEGGAEQGQIALNTIFVDRARPSVAWLPVIPARA